jgi:putative ABC transport system permease protein
MWMSLRYGLRSMAKNPGFTAVAVITLALGIGANTAIFSVVNALLLRSLPLQEPERLVSITASDSARGITGFRFSLSTYEALRDRNRSFTGVAAYSGDGLTLTGSAEPERLGGARVSPNFFDILGVQPLLGRAFTPDEGEPGGNLAVLISHRLWERRFASDPTILGQPIMLNQEAYTVIGVMTPEFPFPFTGVDVWVTKLAAYTVYQPEQIRGGAGFLASIARLRRGVTVAQADADALAIEQQYHREYPGHPDASPNSRLDVVRLQDSITGGIRPALLTLMGAVAFVLLIGCANVASLTLARATGRAKEIALRAALGASRGELMRQLLAESILLAGMGAAAGILLASWGVSLLTQLGGPNLAGVQPIRIDSAALAFTLGISLLTGIGFGLVPALQFSRPDLNSVLRDSGWGSTGGAERKRLRSLLVVGQVALSIVLLIGAGLLVESFRRAAGINAGFNADHTLTMVVNLPPSKYPDDTRRTAFVRDVLGRVDALPGVRAASASLGLPLATGVLTPFLAQGQAETVAAQRPLAEWNAITPGYFGATGVPLLAGREFAWADDAKGRRVVIVNQALARHYWPNENPIGKHIKFSRRELDTEVVGVAGDTKGSLFLADAPGMVIYTVYAQGAWPGFWITIRTAGDATQAGKSVRAQVFAVDRGQPVTNVQTLDNLLARALEQQQQTMYLIAGFAVLALLLAMIGLYGVMAYSVAQRTTEIGIRQGDWRSAERYLADGAGTRAAAERSGNCDRRGGRRRADTADFQYALSCERYGPVDVRGNFGVVFGGGAGGELHPGVPGDAGGSIGSVEATIGKRQGEQLCSGNHVRQP